ncbi:peptidase C45, acyl-coenzyme A - 6-aminopenicillanic acid acyl-transferase [Prauserella sp. PE36]|uniref:Linear amide C-N hydrolase n=1 Tax=Prauserella endophytica TaxID=1592324 RepID=A0ABY2S9K4_9PSEU|nr:MULTISPECIES: C45 family peptidase [Prauserella]RBM21031.1 peptidase C45, acyl-coenzyme A - 6-aminopenicillanic acid acyl-transferase [Prauserella sp. PE36]TKG72191.1 linear amide C-N hydrolase [Prauserella endophytica]
MTTHSEILVGGRAGDFMTVRGLRLTGSQTEIGRGLADAARETYGWRPLAADPRRARARREWFATHWPQHAARLRGAASAAGVDPDAAVFLDSFTGVPEGSACSVTFCPPSLTEEGRGLVGRNYDFFVTSQAALFAMLSGETIEDTGPPMASRPYVITSVPDDGPATTVLTMNELDGCMEGVNEHGLTVALLIADAEAAGAPVDAGPQVGLGSTQLPRFVLDTCATAEQARMALLGAKQYDLGAPLHYLVADASGDAFVWERGPGGDEHIVDAGSAALCVTNHYLHRHPDPANLPEDNAETMETYQRYRSLHRWNEKGELSGPALRAALDDVRYEAGNAGAHPVRTLWRSVLDTGERTMSTRFYLGDNPDGSARYSDELVFAAR